MNAVARKGLVTAVVAGGLLATAGSAQADSAAGGDTAGSPGVLSGNTVQVPAHVPVNVCGNTVDVVGALNSASGQACANTSATGETSPPAHKPIPAPPNPPRDEPSDSGPALAHTGGEGVGLAVATGAGLLLGGVVLRRRFRTGRR
ncbi:chaplin [Streptomyces sp.]|uniref:chaplin n=1 Tax=Streptomyces sp. TaxID=1931 RepID=UPI002F407D28